MPLGSSTTVNAGRDPSRLCYISSKSRNRREEIELQKNFAKAIRVTTVINTHSSRDTGGDIEIGLGEQSQKRSEITIATTGEDGWNKSLPGVSTYDMGRLTPVSGASSVVCQADAT